MLLLLKLLLLLSNLHSVPASNKLRSSDLPTSAFFAMNCTLYLNGFTRKKYTIQKFSYHYREVHWIPCDTSIKDCWHIFFVFTSYARTRLITANHYAHVKCSLLFHRVTRKVFLGCVVQLTRFVQWYVIDTEALRLQFTGKCTALKRLVIESPHHVIGKRQLLEPAEILGKRLMKSKMNFKHANISGVFLRNDHHIVWSKHDVVGLTVLESGTQLACREKSSSSKISWALSVRPNDSNVDGIQYFIKNWVIV